MKLSGWGNYPKTKTKETYFRDISELTKTVTQEPSFIARGMGRSYGDSSLNNSCVVSTRRYNRFLDFDTQAGIVTCESGVTLAEVLAVSVQKGWFLKVTSGTKFVSIGGAIASDIHGKNHHIDGSFSSCVNEFTLLTPKGKTLRCSKIKNTDIFFATFGGMGLTGVILEVEFQLIPISSAYISQTTIKTANLKEAMEAFEKIKDNTYSVAWIDCLAKGSSLGRSLIMAGEHAAIDELSPNIKATPLIVQPKPKLSIPFNLPSWSLNKLTVKAFNELYYYRGKSIQRQLVDYDSFFYPLDSIHYWNRIYGRKGFIQYQCVLPLANSYQGLKAMLELISDSGQGSFLAVLKLFGKQENYLSFPMEGYTLALDFPMNNRLFSLLEKLDNLVSKFDGRIYLAKDARMGRRFFEKTYEKNLNRFLDIKKNLDPENKLRSLQSERLGL
jgi:decaprenylphospho-beta-D-ribofuranose 2-oxidase